MTPIQLLSLIALPGSPNCCLHQHLKDLFARHGRFGSVTGTSTDSLVWPEGMGCYVVRRKGTRCHEGILYIGKCGKVIPDPSGCRPNGSTFSQRVYRWTPYCFQRMGEWSDHFEFGPTFKKDHKLVPVEQRYANRVRMSDIQIDCFITTGNEQFTSPALIETLLLQNHLAVHKSLPPANQEL